MWYKVFQGRLIKTFYRRNLYFISHIFNELNLKLKFYKKNTKKFCILKKRMYLCIRVEQGGSLPDQPIGY